QKDLFVKSEQRIYMIEIARADPKLLDTTVFHFIQENKQTENLKNISNLRETFTEKLIKICTSLPGDEDEEWEHLLSQNSGIHSLPPPSTITTTTTTSANEQDSLTSWTKITKIENPWVTKSLISTKM